MPLWSQSLIPTLRENPQEAEIPSHTLMLRAGLIRRLSGGLYTFLPLGLRALRRVERIVREEMDAAGALEVLMPALQPRELWDRTGRYEAMGDVMFKVRDRQQRELVLGPTHEEVITELAAREINSYRGLPRTFYQIQNKFRDEIRPRFGLMRAKEFSMKDAYSFDLGWDEADASYQAMYNAYTRIFTRCGLRTRVVEADTGAMGGKWSHEFMVLAEAGEDGLVECEGCPYAANLERAERRAPDAPPPPQAAADGAAESPRDVETPGCKTIEQVSAFLRCEPARLIKTLIYTVNGRPAAVLVAGDRDLNEHKLARALETGDVALADDATIERVTGAPVGFAGPVGLDIPVYADQGLRGISGAAAGANRADTHVTGVSLDRDAAVTAYYDLAAVREGDRCPRCGGRLREKRGIEVGHVFKLGTRYSERLGALYLDEHGERKPMVMGCYGIGVTRTLQAVIEQSHDDKGIVWPAAVAPYPVVILDLDPSVPASAGAAARLAETLEARGIDVLVDDRDERPGIKFHDADLIGFPLRVVIGRRGLEQGKLEVKRRTEEKAEMVAIEAAAEAVAARIREWSGGVKE
ncbi:MAG: proline--tRNA ligase [Lentisphaerae bacterium]|nr:proline--tRNA ligase [Lentisphaerota bacterium]